MAWEKGNIRLGLNLPMFLASLIAILSGIVSGIGGVWMYGAWKIAVPEFVKVGHAHGAWWGVLILIAGLLLPYSGIKLKFKKFVSLSCLFGVPLWMMALSFYYIMKEVKGIHAPWPAVAGGLIHWDFIFYGFIIFCIEAWFFGVLALVFLSAFGVKVPFLCEENPQTSSFELSSDIEIPRKVLWVPLALTPFGLVIGWLITTLFKMRGLPIHPAALVQLHTHVFFFAVGYVLVLLVLKALGAREQAFNFVYKLGSFAAISATAGFLVFSRLPVHSVILVALSVPYFIMLVCGALGLFGKFGLREKKEAHFNYLRGAMAFAWIVMTILISVGPLISLIWDTHSNMTVTYKQPEGSVYPGAYPEKYKGTAPVANSPRGLENLHLSPGSWSHVALFWLLVLLIFGQQIGLLLGMPTLIFMAAITIVLAPLFNAFGRIAAWANLPSGIGGMWFAAHPLKFFNVFLLIWVSLVMMFRLRKRGLLKV